MTKQVALCADSFSLRYPEALGLPDENLRSQEWLEVFSDGEEARDWLSGHPEVRRVWVVGSDDMEAINLAAGLKVDCEAEEVAPRDGCEEEPGSREVFLVSGEAGDVPERARAAKLDGVMTPKRFVGCYADEKRVQARALPAECPGRTAPRTADSCRAGRRQGVLLPVVSASGGAGKSTIAVLCACSAARAGYRTLLIDADFQFGDGAELLGRAASGEAAPGAGSGSGGGRSARTFDEVLDGTLTAEALSRECAEGEDGPAVLAALARPERLEACEEAFAAFLPEALKSFDVVVANTPSRWTEVHALLIDHATRVLYVLDQRPAALKRASAALAMCNRCGMATKTITCVLNRCRRGALFTGPDAESALGVAVRELADGGREVEELLALGNAKGLADAYNPLAVGVDELMAEILPRQEAKPREGARGASRGSRLREFFLGRRGGDPCPF